MAQSDTHEVVGVNKEKSNEPNHLIMWLDKHIGKSEKCVLLKASLFTAMDPMTDSYEKIFDKDDINRNICQNEAIRVQFDQVDFMFQAFDDPGKCYEAIKENRHKRIFLIASGSKGELIVPRLVSNFPETFVPNYWIYVFCAKMNMVTTAGAGEPTNDWALDYEDNVLMYNFHDDLLLRLLVDIATYFFTEAERFENSGQLVNAVKYYAWSKRMLQRYDKIDKRNLMASKINEIDKHIIKVDPQPQENDDIESDHMGQSPT